MLMAPAATTRDGDGAPSVLLLLPAMVMAPLLLLPAMLMVMAPLTLLLPAMVMAPLLLLPAMVMAPLLLLKQHFCCSRC
jgi:hypothetical protein